MLKKMSNNELLEKIKEIFSKVCGASKAIKKEIEQLENGFDLVHHLLGSSITKTSVVASLKHIIANH